LSGGERKGRVLIVGLERGLYKKMEPLLTRSLLTVDRVPKGESGLLLAAAATFDLIVLRHPLSDMALGSFLSRVHEPGARCGAAQILVLTDDTRLEEVRGLLPDGARTVMSVRQPVKLLEEVASRLLGVTPRVEARVLMRLEVNVGDKPTLVSCQSENLSETGMLLRSPVNYPLGTRVRFECTLPGERTPLRGEAEVVRHAVSEVEEVQGIGVKVIFWKGDGQQQVRKYLAGRSRR
jgi:DNA-binding NarL/FixJ family response regulator